MHGNSLSVPTKSITVTELTFMELMPVLTKFNKNVTNGLVADTGSQVDRKRDAVSTHGILFS
jgi:hypothetical protein